MVRFGSKEGEVKSFSLELNLWKTWGLLLKVFFGTISTDVVLKAASSRGKTDGKLHVMKMKTVMVS